MNAATVTPRDVTANSKAGEQPCSIDQETRQIFSKPILVLSTAVLLVTAPAVAQNNEYEGHVRYPVQQRVAAPTAAFAHIARQPASRYTAAEKMWFDRVTRPGY